MNLWNPSHMAMGAALMTAFLLGIVHGITPDEHTWPITFSYAIGSYSTRRGLRAGLLFSLAFTLQRAVASELAYIGLSKLLTFNGAENAIYIIVGGVMTASGLTIVRRGWAYHLHLPILHKKSKHNHNGMEEPVDAIKDPLPWMPALHGFIAGWGFGAFALIIYTTLAPSMPSVTTGWMPGALFGLGTMAVQVSAGAFFGKWASRNGLNEAQTRRIALVTAANTLVWGGVAFTLGGIFGIIFPKLATFKIDTDIHIHNLDTIGLPLALVMFTVIGVGMTTLIRESRHCARHAQIMSEQAAEDSASVPEANRTVPESGI